MPKAWSRLKRIGRKDGCSGADQEAFFGALGPGRNQRDRQGGGLDSPRKVFGATTPAPRDNGRRRKGEAFDVLSTGAVGRLAVRAPYARVL